MKINRAIEVEERAEVYVSVKDYAKMHGITIYAVYKRITRGKLESIKKYGVTIVPILKDGVEE